MAGHKQKVICLTKRSGQTFGFYLRMEHNEDGHLVRCLEMGGPAELAGMKDGDRIIRVNGKFTDELSHSEVVELVRNSGASVTFHIINEASYKQAKEQGVKFSLPSATRANDEAKDAPKPKLCYLVKSTSGFGFALRSVKGEPGLFMVEVIPGGVADTAWVKNDDRVLEVNGENIEDCPHDEVVEKVKMAGSSLMLLLVNEDTYRYYHNRSRKIVACLATTRYLPLEPRIISMTKGPDGYGFLLRVEEEHTGHIIRKIDDGSPAERAGLKEMDKVVAVGDQEVESCSHEQVVDGIKLSGNKCCLLVVDKHTDHMYKQGKVSPFIFWKETKDLTSPPSYKEVISSPAAYLPLTLVPENKEQLKPKLCKMKKTTAGYGFRLNGIEGMCGQYIKEVVKDGAADRAGLVDEDIVVEVNGVNVEQSSHEEVVELIRDSGDSLEMLVAATDVYDELKAEGVTITRKLLGETSYVQVHNAESSKEARHHEETIPETSTEQARERVSSVSSHSSEDSIDEKF